MGSLVYKWGPTIMSKLVYLSLHFPHILVHLSLHFPHIICLSYRIYTHMHATSHVTQPKGDPIQLLEFITYIIIIYMK